MTVLPTLALPFVPEISKGRLVTTVMAFAFGTMIEVSAETQKKVVLDLNNGSNSNMMQS